MPHLQKQHAPQWMLEREKQIHDLERQARVLADAGQFQQAQEWLEAARKAAASPFHAAA